MACRNCGCPACKPDATPKPECECGHVREQHTQGCRMTECDCPYFALRDATPKGDGGCTPESMSVLEQHCSDAAFAVIGKARDESYAAGYSAGRDDAARLNVQSVEHVVKLHSETLRALATLMTYRGGEKLLAELGETTP